MRDFHKWTIFKDDNKWLLSRDSPLRTPEFLCFLLIFLLFLGLFNFNRDKKVQL